MTKIVCLSDTHMCHNRINVPEADILIHSGDFTNGGHPDELKEFNYWLGHQPVKHCVVIPGNHDLIFDQAKMVTAPEAEKIVAYARHLMSNAFILIDQGIKIDDINIYGSPWQPWFYDWAFNLPRFDGGVVANQIWSYIPKETDILVTHGPPNGIMDVVQDGTAVGCPYLRYRMMEINIKYHIFGHIHPNFGWKQDGDTIYINAANPGVRKPIVFEYGDVPEEITIR